MGGSIGILAYGSLITDPGAELEDVITERRTGVRTPFPVEFARTSRGRSGAPTLVPVAVGGAQVEAMILLLGGTTLDKAMDMLYRREIGKVGDPRVRYRPDRDKPNQVFVEVISDFHGVDNLLYTRIAANIDDPSPETLARLAISSAREEAGARGRDGISYLRDVQAAGIETPLSGPYAEEILRVTGTEDLDGAWRKARGLLEEMEEGP